MLKKSLMENSFLCSENARVRAMALKTHKSELRQRDEVFDLRASQRDIPIGVGLYTKSSF